MLLSSTILLLLWLLTNGCLFSFNKNEKNKIFYLSSFIPSLCPFFYSYRFKFLTYIIFFPAWRTHFDISRIIFWQWIPSVLLVWESLLSFTFERQFHWIQILRFSCIFNTFKCFTWFSSCLNDFWIDVGCNYYLCSSMITFLFLSFFKNFHLVFGILQFEYNLHRYEFLKSVYSIYPEWYSPSPKSVLNFGKFTIIITWTIFAALFFSSSFQLCICNIFLNCSIALRCFILLFSSFFSSYFNLESICWLNH